jgi:deazaflavin-dependent oxidoreductase (nitroreductase family)
MSFDTPHGTRGARQPSGKLMAWMNRWNMNRIRGNAEKVMGMQALVLSTVGAKSGTPRHTPVAYFPDGADSWLIVASANGAAKNPAWYYNLAAHPDTVQIQIAAAPSRSAPSSCTAPPANTPGATSPARQTVSRNTSRKPTANSPSSGCAPDPPQRSRPHAPTLPARNH